MKYLWIALLLAACASPGSYDCRQANMYYSPPIYGGSGTGLPRSGWQLDLRGYELCVEERG